MSTWWQRLAALAPAPSASAPPSAPPPLAPTAYRLYPPALPDPSLTPIPDHLSPMVRARLALWITDHADECRAPLLSVAERERLRAYAYWRARRDALWVTLVLCARRRVTVLSGRPHDAT